MQFQVVLPLLGDSVYNQLPRCGLCKNQIVRPSKPHLTINTYLYECS